MDASVAREINELMLKYGAELNSSVGLVKSHCTKEEFESYRGAVARILGYMFLDIMNPLYREHPELKPSDFE